MNQPIKLRYVNTIVGAFVILVLLLLVGAVILAGRAQGWFEPTHEIRTVLPDEGTFGLRRGAEVNVLQTPVGVVKTIRVAGDGSLEAILRISGEFTRFVRSDSVAVLQRKFAVAGDTIVEISRGSGDPLPDAGATIRCRAGADIVEEVRGSVAELREGLLGAIANLQALLDEHTRLASDLRSPDGDLQRLLANLQGITEGLERGEGSVGRFLRDPTLATRTEELVATLNTSVEQVGAVLASLQETTAKLPALADTIGAKFDNVPELILQAELTLNETEKLLRSIRNHWLIKSKVEEPAPLGRLPSGAVGSQP